MNTIKKFVTIVVVGASVVGTSGCSTWNKLNTTEKGAVTGGAVGSGLGAIVGSQVGAPGAGIAIGGAAGAATGGLIGHEFDEHSSRQASIEERQRRQDARIKAQAKQIEQLKKNQAG